MKKPDKPRPPKLTDAERHKRFVEVAKKVEASENIADFDKAFNALDILGSPNRRRDTDSGQKLAKP